MYNQTLHRDRKHFCRYCLQSFTTEQILERNIINGETVKFKNYTRKTKLTFMNYVDFLVPEKNGKQNLYRSYTNKYQNHVECSFG